MLVENLRRELLAQRSAGEGASLQRGARARAEMEVEVRSEGREAEANPAKLAGLRRGADFRIALWLPGTLLMSGTVVIPGTVNQRPE